MRSFLVLVLLICLSPFAFGQKSDPQSKLKPTTLQGNGGPGVKSQSPEPGDGNGGPGGGNIFNDNPAPLEQVVKAIIFLNRPLRYFFNVWEDKTGLAGTYLDIYKKLYPEGKPHVQEVLHKLWFNPKLDGPCLDKKGNPQDAVAFNKDPSEICFSVERILKNVNATNYFGKILALGAHELGHRMNLNETLANDLENSPNQTNLVAGQYYYRSWDRLLIENLNDAKKDLNQLIVENDNNVDQAMLCMMLQSTISRIDHVSRMFQETLYYGMWVLSPIDFEKNIFAPVIRDGAAVGYCVKGSLYRYEYDKNFEGKTVIGLQDYARTHFKALHPEYYRNEPVSFVPYGDHVALKTELEGLKQDLKYMTEILYQEGDLSAEEDAVAGDQWKKLQPQYKAAFERMWKAGTLK